MGSHRVKQDWCDLAQTHAYSQGTSHKDNEQKKKERKKEKKRLLETVINTMDNINNKYDRELQRKGLGVYI